MKDDDLLLVITDAAGQRWFHRARWRTLTVGRSDACEVVLGSSRVSRRHLHLGTSPEGPVITDLGSSGGTFVNGLRAEGRTVAPGGAVVEVGPFLVEVFQGGEPPREAKPWPHTGGAAAPAAPERTPLADDEEAISFRTLIDWSTTRPLPVELAGHLAVRLLEEVQRYHALGQLAHALPPEWIWVGRSGAVALRPEAPPEMASGGDFDHYASPELLDRPDADARSDIFAAGLVLYELLCGKHPFPETGPRAGTLPLRGPVPDLRQARPDAAQEVAEVVSCALEACPDDRFSSVLTFRRELDAALEAQVGGGLQSGLQTALAPYFEGEPPARSSRGDVDAASDAAFLVRVEVDDPDGESSELSFPGRGEISVGRHHSNDLVLLSLRMSRRHARFRFEEGRILLEDLGSANGTYVNGQKVRRPTPVAVGDRIEMGGLRLRLRLEEAPAPHLFVVIHRADEAPRRVALHGRPKVTIGAEEEVDLLLDGEEVAGRHARLIVWGERLQLEDLGSEAGTRVGGEAVEHSVPVGPEDLIEIGPWRLQVALDEWPDAEARDGPLEATLLPAPGDRVPGFGGGEGPTTVVSHEGVPLFRSRLGPAAEALEAPAFEETIRRLREVRSPHLYPVAGGAIDAEGPFIDRPCLPGATLAAVAHEPLPLAAVLAIGEGLLEGLRSFWLLALAELSDEAFAPRLDLRHVFVRADGRVLWLGLGTRPSPAVESAGEDLMAWTPETLRNPRRPPQPATLLFSLGQLLYRCATGRMPFARDSSLKATKAVMKDKPLDPREVVPGLPVDLVRYLAGLLEKEPEQRYAGFDEALVELRGLKELALGESEEEPGRPGRLAVREWLKATALLQAGAPSGEGFDEVTAEIGLPLVTDEGPGEA